jgi:hypothetical protein
VRGVLIDPHSIQRSTLLCPHHENRGSYKQNGPELSPETEKLEFGFVTTINTSSSSDAHTIDTNAPSARTTVRAETASKRTTAAHQSALRLINYSANYNVFTTTPPTLIKALITALSEAR